MSYDFAVGQKVVCVDATANPGKRWRGDAPIEGAVYTVADIFPSERSGVIHLCFNEIKRSEGAFREFGVKKLGYWATRFRPVEPKSAELFRAIAADPSKFNFTPSKRERERVRT